MAPANHSVFLCFSIFLIILLNSRPGIAQNRPVYACDTSSNPGLKNFSFCDPSLDVTTRVDDLVSRLTLQEKIGWLVNAAKDFPQVILTAATFNESLFETIGKVVSTEARAMYNVGLAGLTFWSPNVNIFRDPRWGRGQETPGEDPLLSGKYGAAYVRGLQQTDDGDKDKLKVAACCKHYTAYDVDNWKGIQRYTFNALVTQQDLDDTFQPPFKSCVIDGNVASVMCSYNQVNGKPTCGDPDLLSGVIRGQWKLNGYIVTDCDSLNEMFNSQHYTKTAEETAALAMNSGLDLNCGDFLSKNAQSAVNKGLLNETVINKAVSNNFATMMRLGFFNGDPTKQLYGNLGPKDVCTTANQELAREVARQGIVLLKNAKGSLPLSPTAIKTLAVIGPNANVTHTISSRRDQESSRRGDAVVLVMGSDQSIERESLDRVDITLPGQQKLLISEVANVSKGPVILVIMSGGGMDIQFAKDDPKISSILWVGFPGEAGGAAIAM
ncbi:hypothetical protein DH2020_045214 [Rehmannia glutinosa]|uniref:Uncharacterized protein n=1 Tax=Rehmannia glutinosa TaxID=99300 RepID=A0ABR0UES3_REHGL